MAKEETAAAPPGSQAGPPLWLELTLLQSSGCMGRAGQQSMVGRFCSQFTARGELTDATVSILARDLAGSWQSYERPVTLEPASNIAAFVRGLGMPTRKPAVEPVLDTSDTWTHLSVRAQINDQTTQLDLPMQCSGFAGADAEALRQLLRAVFSAAGFAGFDRAVFGEPIKLASLDSAPMRATSPRCCSHCGHEVGAARYSEADDVLCPNRACRRRLLRLDATCQAAPCGHLAPLGADYCWCCGSATAAG